MNRLRLATLWLDGCSGCHMSLLDMDERLLELAGAIDIVYSPLMDVKIFPEAVDITCVEGAVSSNEDLDKLRLVRARTKLMIALGDCAVTGNIAAMRNAAGAETMLNTVYGPQHQLCAGIPATDLPTLHHHALPLHHFVVVDLFIPGCPPAANTLHAALSGLAAGNSAPALATRFGA